MNRNEPEWTGMDQNETVVFENQLLISVNFVK